MLSGCKTYLFLGQVCHAVPDLLLHVHVHVHSQ